MVWFCYDAISRSLWTILKLISDVEDKISILLDNFLSFWNVCSIYNCLRIFDHHHMFRDNTNKTAAYKWLSLKF